mmetsp:Transcript_53375/g.138043  ORF Transcript_53375/g.138043 Transcript_53375/m.138043 type:complete len:91 (-) Transcript_53375:701-973(-)
MMAIFTWECSVVFVTRRHPATLVSENEPLMMTMRHAFISLLTLFYENIAECVAHPYGGHAGERAVVHVIGLAGFRKYHAVVHHSFFARDA